MVHSALLDVVRQQAAAIVAAVWAEARAEAARCRTEADRSIDHRRDEDASRLRAVTAAAAQSANADAARRARIIRSEAKAAVAGRVHRLAVAALARCRDTSYPARFAALAAELPERNWTRVVVNSADAPLARTRFGGCAVAVDDGLIGGVIAEDEGLRVDNTFERRLAAAIVLCLRNASLDRTEAQRRLLERSLLSAPLRDILGQRRHVGAIVAALGGALGGLSRAFLDLDSRYFEAGLKGCEDALMRMYLESIAETRLAAPTRHFLTRFTDLRNLMALYKHLRWELKGPVVLIHGGTIGVPEFRAAVIDDDRAALDALIVRAAGGGIGATSEIGVEARLLTALGDKLARARRERGGEWLVPEYMWRAYVRARNLAVLHHAAGLEPSAVAREMIA